MSKNTNTGNSNTGNSNTGNSNTGDRNTGDRNTGSWNTGDRNTGDRNTGDRNTGDRNTGSWNTGNRNTGNSNTGDRNTGSWNTGNRNTGSWNTGNRNTGYCNSITPKECLIFNKPSTFEAWDNAAKPQWICVNLTKWIPESYMTDKEKESYPSYTTTGGYLKHYTSLTHAYVDAWTNATEKDRELTRLLPNFDEDVFAEVFGFQPFKKKSEVDLLKEQLADIQKRIEELE